jgi:hypothetical protein
MAEQPDLPTSRNPDVVSPQPSDRPLSRTGSGRPGSMALSISRRRFIVRLSIERGNTTIAAIDGGDAQVRDEPRGLALDTLRSLAARNALRGLATRTAALGTDQGTGIGRPPRPILRQAPSTKGPHGRSLFGQNCTIILTDVVGFAARSRTEHDRLAIRDANARMLCTAILSPFEDASVWEDRGDGLLIVVYPDVPTTAVLDRLLTVLPGELRQHNEDGKPGTQFQLRVAVTVGPVVADMTGLSGKDIIRAARMLDTPAFKKAMTRTGSALGVITSAFVHDTAIETGPGMPGAADFAPVRVQVKESRFAAWVRLFEPPLIDVA